MKKTLLTISLLAIVASFSVRSFAQNPAPVLDERAAAGDEPDSPGPLATDLDPNLKRAAIVKAMTEVASWQLHESKGRYNIGWTFAALYDGLLAASKATGDNRYRDRVFQVAQENKWEFGPRFAHADDEAIGLTYLTLYAGDQKPEEIAGTRNGLDKLLARPDDPNKNLWWWCDALYMAPPVLAQLSGLQATIGTWTSWIGSGGLLPEPFTIRGNTYFFGNVFLTMHEANGKKVLWSRGNGWVLAGAHWSLNACLRIIRTGAKYEQRFKDMADALRPAATGWPVACKLARSGLISRSRKSPAYRILYLRHGIGNSHTKFSIATSISPL